MTEKAKEGTDGVVYGDGYPQEDYFELAQVYTPVYVPPPFIPRGGQFGGGLCREPLRLHLVAWL